MAVKFRGRDKHLKRLKAMGPRVEREASKLTYTLADMHVKEAQNLITTGSVSGKNHVPSRPGEPPNNEWGDLANSGHVEKLGPFKANSVFDAPHAVPLEWGTSNMAERPFARPAARTIRREAETLAKAAAKRISKGGTL
jgi:hypothetical protein